MNLSKFSVLGVAVVNFTVAAFAVVPDVTASMESLGNPGKVRWPDNPVVRGCVDLQFYNGKLYNSGGEVETNPGPVYIHTIDPKTKEIKFEVSLCTEETASYKIASWGDLVTPAEDPAGKEKGPLGVDPLGGDVFIRNAEGKWRSANIPGHTNNRNHGLAYNTHTWDMVEYGKRFFAAGYGLVSSSDRFKTFQDHTWWTNATAHTEGGIEASIGGKVVERAPLQWLRRQVHFLKFPKALYAVPNSYISVGSMTVKGCTIQANIVNQEISRWNEAANRFEEARFVTSDLFPDVTKADLSLVSVKESPAVQVRIWKPTSFKNRALYVLSLDSLSESVAIGENRRGGYTYTSYPLPLAGYSAVNNASADGGKGLPKATRIAFGEGEFPWDFAVNGDAVYALTSHWNAEKKLVTHSIWKSTDGLKFNRLLTFDFRESMISLEYNDGWFYVGEGCFKGTPGWPCDKSASDAGAIYRFRLPGKRK